MEFDGYIIQQVWEKCRATSDQDPTEWRKDECGAWVKRDHYGNEESEYGWKIANVSKGGPDELENLRPFHHANSFDIAVGRPKCHITADRSGVEQPTQHIDEPRNRSV